MQVDLGYLAGFFDGEGSIGIYKNGNGTFFLRTQLTQTINNNSTIIFQYLLNRYGGNLNKIKKPKKYGMFFNWQLNSDKARLFLEEIFPYLILKSNQAKIAIWWENKRPKLERDSKGRVKKIPQWEQNLICSNLLKILKKKDIQFKIGDNNVEVDK